MKMVFLVILALAAFFLSEKKKELNGLEDRHYASNTQAKIRLNNLLSVFVWMGLIGLVISWLLTSIF